MAFLKIGLTKKTTPEIVSNMQAKSLQPIPSSRLRPLRDEAYERLRAAILDGVHAPGDWLREEEISHQLGISRMPVREALRRLENEGFLEHFPNRGSQVTEIYSDDLTDVYDARMLVESRMAKLAAKRITPGQLQRMEENLDAFAKAQGKELTRLAGEFNELLMEASGNNSLRHIYRMIMDIAVRVRHKTHSNPLRKEDTLREHLRIYEALKKGDPALAETATTAHVNSVKARTLLEVVPSDKESGKNKNN